MDLPPDEGPYPARGKDRGALDEAVFGQPLSGIGAGLPSVPDELLPIEHESHPTSPPLLDDQHHGSGFTLIHFSPGMPEAPRLAPRPPSRPSPPIEAVEAVPLPDDFTVGKPIEIHSQVEQWLKQFAEPPAEAEPADSGETFFDMGPIQVEEPEHPPDTEEAPDCPTDLASVPETPPVDEDATLGRVFLEDDPAPCPGPLESPEESAHESEPDEEATQEVEATPPCEAGEPEPIAMIESVSEPESEALVILEIPDAFAPEPEPEQESLAEREPPEELIPAPEPDPVAAIEPEAVVLPKFPEEEITEPEPVAAIEPEAEPEREPEPVAVIEPEAEPEPIAIFEPEPELGPEPESIAVIPPAPAPEREPKLPPIPLTMHCVEEIRLEAGQTVRITREMIEVRGPIEPSQMELILLIGPEAGSLLRLNEPLEAGDRFSQDDIDNDRIRYCHMGNEPGADSFTLATPGGEIEETTIQVVLLRRHRAPELIGPAQLLQSQEGCLVEDVLQDAVRTWNPDLPPGLAVLSLHGRGDWDYLLPGEKTWLALSDAGPSRALLLGPSAMIRFTPRAGWTGRIELRFRAWDRSRGTEGDRVDLSVRWASGGGTAFSAEAGKAMALVSSRFPRLNIVEPWVEELSAEDLIGEGMAVVRAEGAGVWQFSLDGGRSWLDIGPVYHGRARLLREQDRVRFLPRKGGSGKVTLIARPWDGSGPEAGSVANLAGHQAFGDGTPFGESLQTRSWRLDGS